MTQTEKLIRFQRRVAAVPEKDRLRFIATDPECRAWIAERRARQAAFLEQYQREADEPGKGRRRR